MSSIPLFPKEELGGAIQPSFVFQTFQSGFAIARVPLLAPSMQREKLRANSIWLALAACHQLGTV